MRSWKNWGSRVPCISSSIWTVKETENYTLNAEGTGYELTKTIEELQEDGSIVLTGTEVESASAGALSDSTTSATEYGVDLTLTDEGTKAFAEATEEAYNNGQDSIAIYYDGDLISVPVSILLSRTAVHRLPAICHMKKRTISLPRSVSAG